MNWLENKENIRSKLLLVVIYLAAMESIFIYSFGWLSGVIVLNIFCVFILCQFLIEKEVKEIINTLVIIGTPATFVTAIIVSSLFA